MRKRDRDTLEQAAVVAMERTEQIVRSGAGAEELTALTQEWQRIHAALPAEHEYQPDVRTYLSLTQFLLFRVSGRPEDLDQAISICRTLLAESRNAEFLVTVRGNLAAMVMTRFEVTGDPADLDESIGLSRSVTETLPAGHPDLASAHSNLSNALRRRFLRTDARADLDLAIEHGRLAVQGMPGNPDPVTNLAAALRARFARYGVRADLDEAIEFAEFAATAPDQHPNRASLLNNLGSVLINRFQEFGDRADVLRAVEVLRAAVAACPPQNAQHLALVTSQLGAALRHKFERGGDLDDADEAIAALQASLAATSRLDPGRHQRATNLSYVLRLRYGQTSSGADLDQAIHWAREALDGLPADHPDRAHVFHLLAVVLDDRFQRSGRPAELDEAIEASRQSVAGTPDGHQQRIERVNVLGSLLQKRAAATGSSTDLDEAIEFGGLAVQLATTGTPPWLAALSNYALSVRHRSRVTESPDDLREAIAAQRAVLAATAADSPEYAPHVLNLANSLLIDEAANEATGLFLEAAYHPASAPSIRIDAAASAATMLLDTDLAHAARLLELAVRLLPERASYRLAREDQQQVLGGLSGLTSHAASLALLDDTRVGESPALRAVRLLELGRGVMLSQTMDGRSDLTELQDRQPEAAAGFLVLRNRLDRAVPGDDRHRLSVEFAAVLAEIRRLEGFESFLLPPEPTELLRYAGSGPVVILNVSKYSSDALLVTTEGITALPLQELGYESTRDRILAFLQALEIAHDPAAGSRARIEAQNALDEVLGWLWDAAVGPVLEHLGYRGTPADGETWPRVWWVPVGPMALLPVHAAGHHRRPATPTGRPTAMDRVVSSYTPTLRALGYARERDSAVVATDPALIVAMPTTPGLDQPLRHAAREAELVQARLPAAALLLETVDSPAPPTKSAVLARLGESAIAHFACHGSDQPDDPSRSRLLLRDHATDPLTVGDIVPIRLDKARLAYLSACRTALSTATDLMDEAIHLSTAFLLAGYPHVVGTLWEIDDSLAATIADDFYAALLSGEGVPAAHALHSAVRAARDRLPRTPSLWAGHIHTGA